MPESNDDAAGLKRDLPWLVNGSLPAAEREPLEQALAQHPEWRAEQAFFERLRASVREEEAPSPGELGWRRLQARIAQEALPPHRQRHAANGLWRPLAIAASVLLAVQVVWLYGPLRDESAYQPLGGPGVVVPADAVVLQLRLRPDARMADVQALFVREGAEIVSGPSASGVLRVTVPKARQAAALAALRGADGVVESVAPE